MAIDVEDEKEAEEKVEEPKNEVKAEMKVTKKMELGSLTVSPQGLRKMADYLENHLKENGLVVGDILKVHYIVTYTNNIRTIGVDIDNEVIPFAIEE